MPPNAPGDLSRTIETLYRSESGRILATLVRLLGDLDLAEEAMHEAFAAALDKWPQAGIPDKPRPWLISTARFKAIDAMRRRARFDGAQADLALYVEAQIKEPRTKAPEEEEIEDDRLRLIFTCCHPTLPPEGQVALTLREVCGLTTEEIARAFLVTQATLAQRIVRAKAVIRDKAIHYQVPASQELSARLGAVLQVVYLVFNEGYPAEATGAELSREAIRLGRLLLDLLPESDVMGLLALMLLQEWRRSARSSAEGELILLDRQDRSLWNRGPDRRRHRAHRERSSIAPFRCLHPAGGHCGSSRRGFLGGVHGLAPDHAALRPADSCSAISGRGTQPRICRRHVRRSGGGSSSHRWLAGARETRQLSPRALRPCGSVPQIRTASGGPCFV
jgi:RNA polymerase sigma factor (sigma-70 family)